MTATYQTNDPSDEERLAEALEAFLSREGRLGQAASGTKRDPSGGDHALPVEEARLGAALRSLANKLQADPDFQSGLEKRLTQAAQNKTHKTEKRAPSGFRPARWLAWGALAAVLIIGLSWALSNLLPRDNPPAAPPEIRQETATPTPALAVNVVESTPAPTSASQSTLAPLGTTYVLPIQPDVDFILKAEFPEGPAEATIYRQASWEALTIENARQAAAQLGVDGGVYTAPFGPPGSTSYRVQDGNRSVIFIDSPHSIQYESGNPIHYEKVDCQPPCLSPEAQRALETFLVESQLADFPFMIRPSLSRPQTGQVVQLIDGKPLSFKRGNYQGEAQMSSTSEVLDLDLEPIKLEGLGNFPILTAQQAWEQLTREKPTNGIEIMSRTLPPVNAKTWQRTHALNQEVELFGNLSVYPSAEAGLPALVLFDGYPVSGNTQGMAEIGAQNPFVQVWGQFLDDGEGGRTLQVNGWQASPFPDQTLSGVVERRDGEAFLIGNGQTLRLPELPPEVPEGETLMAYGVVVEGEQPTLEWSFIGSESGFGGGGGGGREFPELNLEGGLEPLPTEAPAPTPVDLTGQRLEGTQGRPLVFIHQYSDGSTRVEVMFYPDPGQIEPDQSTLFLEGAGLAGIEAYHNLPVRIWGAISGMQAGGPVVTVERVEPVYPGMTVQTWLGKAESVTMEGREVLVFTAADGAEYVLSFSLEDPSSQSIGAPGDPLVVEGVIVPGQTLSGYPVITDYAINPGTGLQDLSNYQPQSVAPLVIQERGAAGARRIGTIELVELAYTTDEPRYLDRSSGLPLPYVQLVWRFAGRYDDGSLFEIYVQAIDPRFLK